MSVDDSVDDIDYINTTYVNNISISYEISTSNFYDNAWVKYYTDCMGVRPIINVDSNAVITSGNGTLNDYYVLGEYRGNINITGALTNVKIGEYVNLNNKTYRVVENGNAIKWKRNKINIRLLLSRN